MNISIHLLPCIMRSWRNCTEKAKYYSMDPFHEGGNTEGVDFGKGGNFYYGCYEESESGGCGVMQAWQAKSAGSDGQHARFR